MSASPRSSTASSRLRASAPSRTEDLLVQLRVSGEWMFEPGFRRLDPGYVRDSMEAAGSPRSPFFELTRRQTTPAESLFVRRMEGILLSTLGELRAGADWSALIREYGSGESPSTELGEAEAAFYAGARDPTR